MTTAAKPARVRGLHRMTPGKALIYALLILWAVTTLFPFVWVINNSFKDSSLVVSDSFTPAVHTIYSRDQFGRIEYEETMKDEYGREMYREYLTNEDGSVKLERDVNKPVLDQGSAFAGLMGYNAQAQLDETTADLPAYDTSSGRVYDETSAPVRLSPTLKNYVSAFTNNNVNILRGYRNSLIISGTVMLAVMLLSTMMAFALTRYRFRGQGVIRSLVVAALMFPAFSTIVPVYRMITNAGLFDTLGSVIIVQTAGNLAFACTVMMGFVTALPYELEEAAFMEGCGVYNIFFRIVLPMCRPALATVAIFTFIWSYNDLFVQMVLLRSKTLMPVCAILREISSQYGTDYGLMAAAVAIVVIPVMVLYLFLQKNIIRGLTAGAVKG
ncbi:MAG: carbohydrate ABC transporter permease [Clostridia bacterium]|nr:carbohydrate ABC transporter permease [Clostridia bacterium]